MPFNKTKNSYLDLCQFIKYRVQFFEENWNLKLKALNPVSLLKIYKKNIYLASERRMIQQHCISHILGQN